MGWETLKPDRVLRYAVIYDHLVLRQELPLVRRLAIYPLFDGKILRAKTLSQLGKDYEVLDCIASEFMIDGGTLSLLAADANGNAHFSIRAETRQIVERRQAFTEIGLPRGQFNP